jgi:nitroreductase
LPDQRFQVGIVDLPIEFADFEGIQAPHADRITDADPPAALIPTSVLSRSEVKYGHKAYDFSPLGAGHMARNIQLACEERGLGSCGVGGYVDGEIAELLDLTEEECPLYAIALERPRDAAGAPPPAG